MDVFRQLPDDVEEQAEDGVEEDVRGCSIILTISKQVAPALRTDLLNLKKPAQRPRHIQLMEQKDQDNEKHQLEIPTI